MTYKKLLELIKDMSPEQQEMVVIIALADEYREVSIVSSVNHADDDSYPIGQPILS